MAELWLVCEGDKGSVDADFVKRVFATVLSTEIVVVPGAGKKEAKIGAKFLENHRGGKAAYVTDRDYQPRIDAENAFADGKPGFLWRRHSIENYLLSPKILSQAFQRLRERMESQQRGRVPSWIADLPVDLEQIAELLRQCASTRAAEEACRLANHRLWAALPSSVGQVQKRDPPAPTTSGAIGPADWREALCQEIERVCTAATQTAACPQFRREIVAPFFDEAYAEVTADSYIWPFASTNAHIKESR